VLREPRDPGPEAKAADDEQTTPLPERKKDRLSIPKAERPKDWSDDRLGGQPNPTDVPGRRGAVTYIRGADGTIIRVEEGVD
jgi:hypothetical protein